MSTNIYIPPNSISLDKIDIPQIRLGIQGAPGVGKTWSALTFPNGIVADFNRGLGAHKGKSNILCIPFYDNAFVAKLHPRDPTNRREAFATWLETDAQKLTKDQSLIVDSSTDIEITFHKWEDAHPTLTKEGKYNDFAEWANKMKYFGRITEALTSLKCNVVWISHETPDRDKKGELNGKIRPLLTGQFGDKIAGFFTDWVRQQAIDKPTDIKPESLSKWGMNTKEEFKLMCDTFPRQTIYFWQLESDDLCNCKVSSLINFPRYIPANYQSFINYLRK